MAEEFDLGAYKCTSLPKTLWRVTHSKSQSRRDPATGDLVASDSTRTICDKPSLKQAAEEHFDWGCRQPSCFLSVFKCEQHARRWAKQRMVRDLSLMEAYIHEIDTTRLPAATHVFDAVSLTAKLNITHPHSTDELIFLHRIPGESFRHTWSLGEIEEQEADAREYAARQFNPDFHYVSELGGWYDTDEECEERNRADDIIKMIEGDWNW